MILPINDRYRIKSDQYCWTFRKTSTDSTDQLKEDWRPVTYHPTIEQAVSSLSERMLRTSSAVGFVEGLEELKRIGHAFAGHPTISLNSLKRRVQMRTLSILIHQIHSLVRITNLLVPTVYRFAYVRHSYVMVFEILEVFIEFRIIDEGKYFGVLVKRYYNVKKVNKKYRPPPTGSLTRDMRKLFGPTQLKEGRSLKATNR